MTFQVARSRSQIPQQRPAWMTLQDWNAVLAVYAANRNVFPAPRNPRLWEPSRVYNEILVLAAGLTRPAFTAIKPAALAEALYARYQKPDAIKQENANLCGPGSFLYVVLQKSKDQFVRFVIELYLKGEAQLGEFEVDAHDFGDDLLKYDPVKQGWKGNLADWIAMASIRNSENFWDEFSTRNDELSAATTANELEDWLEDAGFSDVKDEVSAILLYRQDLKSAREASALIAKNYWIFLMINANMLDGITKKQGKKGSDGFLAAFPNHWIVLLEPIREVQHAGQSVVEMKYWSWGQEDTKFIPKEAFLSNYYGYVAAKY